MTTVNDVVTAWVAGERAKTKNLATDGASLWSFQRLIAWRLGNVYATTPKRYSVATMRHAKLARGAASIAGFTAAPEGF